MPRLKRFRAEKEYEARRSMTMGSLIIEAGALRDLVERHWGRIKGVSLRAARFFESREGLLAEIILRAKEEVPPEMIRAKNAAIKKDIETFFLLPVDAVCVRREKAGRA
jgi:hypothetical protein